MFLLLKYLASDAHQADGVQRRGARVPDVDLPQAVRQAGHLHRPHAVLAEPPECPPRTQPNEFTPTAVTVME